MKLQKKIMDFEEFKQRPFGIKYKARNYFNSNDYLLDEFISCNKKELGEDEITILQGFKKRITRDFVLLKTLKSYTIFIDTKNTIYGVYSLSDSLDEMLLMPAVAKMTILPFKGKIVYDGFINSYNMHIGPNMCRGYQDLLNEKRRGKNIITQLD